MPGYSIEARSFCVALAWCHNFWVLKNADSGATVAELHGLAYDRISRKILPIGTTRNHALRVFLFAHDAAYAEEAGCPVHTTRMYSNSLSHVVHQDADSLARWQAAVNALPLLDGLDLTYPPFGFSLRTPTVNSNSAYRTFGEIMDVPVHDFPGRYRPGFSNTMITAEQIAAARYRSGERGQTAV